MEVHLEFILRGDENKELVACALFEPVCENIFLIDLKPLVMRSPKDLEAGGTCGTGLVDHTLK